MAYSCQFRAVRRNRGGRGVGWAQMLGAWCLPAFVAKTDKFKRPLSGRLNKEKL
jgi:hypothetical protein